MNGGVPGPDRFRESTTRHGGRLYSDNPPVPTGAKYPLMSTTKSVLLVAYTSMLPPAPAGTIAALATTTGVAASGSGGSAFKVATTGRLWPVAQAVRKPTCPGATAVKFSE